MIVISTKQHTPSSQVLDTKFSTLFNRKKKNKKGNFPRYKWRHGRSRYSEANKVGTKIHLFKLWFIDRFPLLKQIPVWRRFFFFFFLTYIFLSASFLTYIFPSSGFGIDSFWKSFNELFVFVFWHKVVIADGVCLPAASFRRGRFSSYLLKIQDAS